MKFKDETGRMLYGFSQENLEKTNKEIRRTNFLLQMVLIFTGILLAMVIALAIWLDVNNIFTRLIGG